MNTYALHRGASLSNCRLEYGNGVFYPETEYDSDSKVRIFHDLMAYAIRKNDYNTGTQLNLANYSSLFPLIYFDLNYRTEKVTIKRSQTADFQIQVISQCGSKFCCTCCCSL